MTHDLSEADKMSLAKETYQLACKRYDQAKHDLAIALTIHDKGLHEDREYREYRKARKEYNQALDEYRRAFKEYDQVCGKKKFKSLLERLLYKLWRK